MAFSTTAGRTVLELRTDAGAFYPAGDQARVRKMREDVDAVGTGASKSAGGVSGLMGSLGKLGPAIVGAFSAGAIVAATNKVLDFAGHTVDLSAKLGMSTSAIQKFSLAFEQSGVGIETVAKASAELASRIASGDKGAIATLQKLGVNIQSLQRMNMEDMFITAADAVGNLQNKGEQIYASKTLFGKPGVELLAGLDGKLAETTKKFEDMGLVIDEQTLKAADDFGDQLGLMGKQLLAIGANAIGPLLPMLSALGNALVSVAKVLGDVLGAAVKWAYTGLLNLGKGIDLFLASVATAATKIPVLGKHLGFAADAAAWFRKDAAAADAELKRLWSTTDAGVPKVATASTALIGLGTAAGTAGNKADRLKQIADSLFERDVLQRANDLAKALGGVQNLSKLSADKTKELREAVLAAIAVYQRTGQTVPPILTEIAARTATITARTGDLALAMKAIPTTLLPAITGFEAMAKHAEAAAAAQEKLAKAGMIPPNVENQHASQEVYANVERQKTYWDDLGDHVLQVARGIQQSIADNLAGALVRMSSWKDAFLGIWDSIRRGFASILADMLNQFIGGFLNGALGALMGKRGAFANAFAGMFGGGPGSVFGTGGDIAMSAAGKLLGIGGGTSAMTLAPGFAAGLNAAAAGTSAMTLAPGFEAGLAAAGAGAGAGGGASFGATMAALATNPITIAAAATLAGLAFARAFTRMSPEMRKAMEVIEREAPAGTWRAIGPNGELFGGAPGRRLSPETLQGAHDAYDMERQRRLDAARESRRRRGGVFHTGGVVGYLDAATASYRDPFGDLKPNEVIAKLLKGEAVLTPEATAAIGGRPVIDMLNGGSAADRILALITSKGSRGGLGGMVAGGPPSPWSLPFQRESLSADVQAVIHSRFEQLFAAAAQQRLATPTAPAVPSSQRDGSGITVPRQTTVNINVSTVDADDFERVMRTKIVPRLKTMIRTNQDQLGYELRRNALD